MNFIISLLQTICGLFIAKAVLGTLLMVFVVLVAIYFTIRLIERVEDRRKNNLKRR